LAWAFVAYERMKPPYIEPPMRGMTGREPDCLLLFSKDNVSISSMLIKVH